MQEWNKREEEIKRQGRESAGEATDKGQWLLVRFVLTVSLFVYFRAQRTDDNETVLG